MKIRISHASDRKPLKWAGGTTTQLAIFPPHAEYGKFNFQFRLSTATVDIEESTFTFMPGVKRHLMILKGVLDIDHKGRYKKHLDKFGYDIFDGEWPTTAKGKVTDFNLMTTGKVSGKLQALILRDRQEETIEYTSRTSFSGIYILEGTVRLIAGTQSAELKKGDFIFCDHENESQILHIQSIAASELILATLQL